MKDSGVTMLKKRDTHAKLIDVGWVQGGHVDICDLICKNPEQSGIYGCSVSCILVLKVL